MLRLGKGHEYLRHFYALLLVEWNKYLLTTCQQKDLCRDKEISTVNTKVGHMHKYWPWERSAMLTKGCYDIKYPKKQIWEL